jgi:hypothetical protein
MSKQYETFDEMLTALDTITVIEAKRLGFDRVTREVLGDDADSTSLVEDFGEHAAIFACYKNNELVKELAKRFDLQIITYSIGDAFSLSTGMSFVNREKYLFCRSKEDAWSEEPDDSEDIDEEETQD